MIEKIFIISFLVFAIHYSMKEGEIFSFLGNWLYRVLPKKLHNPVFECVVCMGGIFGAACYWLIYAAGWKEWIVVNISVIGLNAIINQLKPTNND